MAEEIRFDGRVAIVTGAGGGMGRLYAIELARRGASVLVNDYGGSVTGMPGSAERAEAVASEIAAAGGAAVANGTAVGTDEAAEEIVRQAMEAFGRVDILINNAGIALPGAMMDLPFARIEQVYRTNLTGPHALMRAAWPAMRRQGYGRMINITSNAVFGIGGNSAYASTKAGMIGLTLDAALEGAPCGILVNAVMPVAYTRMIEQVPDPAFVGWMRTHFPPEQVASPALYLLSEGCRVNGRIFTIGGGRIARIGFAVNRGHVAAALTPELVAGAIAEAGSLAEPLMIEKQSDEMNLYTMVAPFTRETGPGLANDALTGLAAGKSSGGG